MASPSDFVRTRDRRPPSSIAGDAVAMLYLAFECARPLEPALAIRLDRDVILGRGPQRGVIEEDGVRVVRVADECMSGRHARIERDYGRWVIADLGSRNGTSVDGRPCIRTVLEDGALIELGETLWLFREYPAGAFDELDDAPALAELTTLEPTLRRAYGDLVRVAASRVSVVLEGETGTGKEVVARAVHALSARTGPFVAVNCGAIPAHLVESELFGHRRGAFSGAVDDHPGVVRASDGGTLFRDEIGELPAASQVALLRVLQEREVMPVGGTRPTKVDLRVVAATNRNLAVEVRAGRFRADLHARLAGYELHLPPLRERREDLGGLIATMLQRVAPQVAPQLTFDIEAARALYGHSWPLNVRELEKALETAAVLARRARIELGHLPRSVRSQLGIAPVIDDDDLDDDERALRDQLVALLTEHQGNIAEVGRRLGKGRQQIHRWLKRLDIAPEQFRR